MSQSEAQQQSHSVLLEKVATTENIEALCKFTRACNLLAEVAQIESNFIAELLPCNTEQFLIYATANLTRMDAFVKSIGD